MDYFSEIADNPDLREALGHLTEKANYPKQLQNTHPPKTSDAKDQEPLQQFPLLVDSHPGIWRAELINWFHLHPDFAAAAWCMCERLMLARAVRAASEENPPKPSSILKELGLSPETGEEEFKRSFAALKSDKIDRVRRQLGIDYRIPVFIKKLLELDQWRIRIHKLIRDRQLGTSPTDSLDTIATLIADRNNVQERAKQHGTPIPFDMVHEQELEQIDDCRKQGCKPAIIDGAASPPQTGAVDAPTTNAPSRGRPRFAGAAVRRALESNLIGVAFSGGGIRSATFNLGVLQALAKLNVLRHCDYLSTVSGGGYIGAWFTAWTMHEAENYGTGTMKDVQDRMRLLLSPERIPHPLDARVRPIRYLREFSNYLTPQTGFFSADTWTMVAVYVRNLLLNLLVLIPLIAAVLILPQLTFDAANWLPFGSTQSLTFHFFGWNMPNVAELIILIGVCIPLTVLLPNLWHVSASRRTPLEDRRPTPIGKPSAPWYARQGVIQILVVVPFLLASCLTATYYWSLLQHSGTRSQDVAIANFSMAAGAVFLVYLGLIHLLWLFVRIRQKLLYETLSFVIATLGAAGVAVVLFWILGKIFLAFGNTQWGYWRTLSFGTPLTLATYSLIVVIQLGLLGTRFPDEQREWWSRLRAWALIYSFGWAALFTVAIWIPVWTPLMLGYAGQWGGWGAIIVWALSTLAGVRSGNSATTANSIASPAKPDGLTVKTSPSVSTRVQSLLFLVTPYIFIVGLFVLISLAVTALLPWWLEQTAGFNWFPILLYDWPRIAVLALLLLTLSVFVSWRIGVNEFSLHNFYKNRLVRCYLGASRWKVRKADWFTGFDRKDDIPLSCFDHASRVEDHEPRYPGPYLILNSALNLAGGKDLAWQERKATSFVFTPKYCGYDADRAVLKTDKDSYWPDAYAPTRLYVTEPMGPTIGMAMAISGAAANPNMGKATSTAMAFLMTVFNVRLGWWLPNPRRKEKPFGWNRAGPTLGINYTAVELFGMTDDEKKFINISDGGHFENLGVYELIRRGCRYVIASDAGQDGAFGLEDLGNLVRKCRTDFGVEIEIGTDLIRDRIAKGWSSTHCVVGKIHYLTVPEHDDQGNVIYDHAGQPKHAEGLLLYLKPSITGDEPFDILEYYRSVPEFPHESTADQWFNESQFESYRRLGMHIAETAFARYRERPDDPIASTHHLFEQLKGFWHPPSPKVAEHSTAHAQEYTRVMELLRSHGDLGYLDSTIFNSMIAGNQRDEFYVCNALIQLIENVYADLDLEQNFNHPHVEGWMNVFKDWVNKPAFKRAWKIGEHTYASRFRNFYNQRLVK